jgi:SAM-dependent methyltransferase
MTRPSDRQTEHNAEVWTRGEFLESYAGSELKPIERLLLERHREALARRVLELGCGAGRLSSHLVARAAELHGLDIAPAMVEHCRRAYPLGTFAVGDIRDLSQFQSAYFDVVVAAHNVLDVLGESDRAASLAEMARVLRAGGLLLVSSHNLAYAPRIPSPGRLALRAWRHPRGMLRELAKLPRRARNRRLLERLERVESDHAILIDEAHDYSLVHYYVSRDGQERQLAEAGLELIECLDLDGRAIPRGDWGKSSSELHYAARR